ncbi:ABC transporter permease subunit [Halobaculum sp. MBLA0147]|uniref:ABC transporter permease subunit n=1 Tax=Halobaculum sp. MBLA0147 TaxID=3079934 RepID=UPI00352589C1
MTDRNRPSERDLQKSGVGVAQLIRHELLVIRRSALGRTTVAVCVLAPVFGALLGVSNGSPRDPVAFRSVLLFAWLSTSAVVPLAAIVATAGVVAGAAETGTLRLLVGLPVRRERIVLGAFLSRALVVLCGTTLGTLATGLLLVAAPPAVGWGRFVGFGVFTALLVVSYVALGTAVTTSVRGRTRAFGLALAVFGVSVVWPQIAASVGETLSLSASTHHVVGTLSPFGAYAQAISDRNAILGAAPTTPLLGTGANAAVLCAWTLIGLVVARRQFAVADL